MGKTSIHVDCFGLGQLMHEEERWLYALAYRVVYPLVILITPPFLSEKGRFGSISQPSPVGRSAMSLRTGYPAWEGHEAPGGTWKAAFAMIPSGGT